MPAPAPIADRLDWLRRFRDAVRVHHLALCALASEETGKPHFEALTADILPLVSSCNWHLRRAGRLLRPRRVGGGGLLGFGHACTRHRVPVGRVLIIATWNYPVQLLGIQLVQAVVAGNAVVVKPSERAPRTQAALLALATEAADAVPSMREMISVREATREAGRRVLAQETFDHVVFTGSTAVGRAIAEVCAGRLIPTTLELSGSDSAIVLADADARAAARAVFMGCTTNAGQTCMAPRRALVAREVHAVFTEELTRLVAAARRVTLVDEHAARVAHEVVTAAVRSGGRLVTGAVDAPDGRSMHPVAVADCPVDTDLFLGRHFGPLLAVRAVDSIDEALALHARAGQFLATSIWTARPGVELAERARACGSSLVHFNAVLLPSAHPAIAIAGHGASGWGASRGESGLLGLTREVTVTRNRGWFEIPLQEPSSAIQSALSRFIAWPLRAVVPTKPDAGPGPRASSTGQSRPEIHA